MRTHGGDIGSPEQMADRLEQIAKTLERSSRQKFVFERRVAQEDEQALRAQESELESVTKEEARELAVAGVEHKVREWSVS
jgi:hypothetical protein